jgi:hypothetical protein
MSNFSDKEDRILIQLVHRHDISKGKRTSWINIAAKMKTKKTPQQLRLRVVCLKKRFGEIIANFPRWYFQTPKPSSYNGSKNGREIATLRSAATIMAQSREAVVVQQLVKKVNSFNTAPKM